MRRPLIAGNWKMFKTVPEAVAMVRELRKMVDGVKGVDVVIAPPFTALTSVASIISGTAIKLAAQNLYWAEEGAYTGEISPKMLKDSGCQMVIIGHSERRQYFHETDEAVYKKTSASLKYQLWPIVCLGETLQDREKGETFQVIRKQMTGSLLSLKASDMVNVTIAYEPVWAIGTGRNATPAQANEVHGFIRTQLKERYDSGLAESVRILYGGSVKPANIRELMAESEIDGALVGGASLEAESFARIVCFDNNQ